MSETREKHDALVRQLHEVESLHRFKNQPTHMADFENALWEELIKEKFFQGEFSLSINKDLSEILLTRECTETILQKLTGYLREHVKFYHLLKRRDGWPLNIEVSQDKVILDMSGSMGWLLGVIREQHISNISCDRDQIALISKDFEVEFLRAERAVGLFEKLPKSTTWKHPSRNDFDFHVNIEENSQKPLSPMPYFNSGMPTVERLAYFWARAELGDHVDERIEKLKSEINTLRMGFISQELHKLDFDLHADVQRGSYYLAGGRGCCFFLGYPQNMECAIGETKYKMRYFNHEFHINFLSADECYEFCCDYKICPNIGGLKSQLKSLREKYHNFKELCNILKLEVPHD